MEPKAFNAVVLNAAVQHMFFYLCRASECGNSGGVDADKVLRGCDVALKRDGRLCLEGDVADEVTRQFRKTKADQQAFGSSRTHYCTGDALVCPVRSMEVLRSWAPERFGRGPEAQLPLFRWYSGAVLKREEVQELLQKAATAVGLPPGRFMSHSLRIGGASALYHATNDIELVKRFGRWSSGAVHGYLWESADQYRGVATKMANDTAAMHYT